MKRPILRLLRALPLLTAVLVSGCAGLDVTPVLSDKDEASARGFRYYQPAPFLLVYSDGKGGLISQIKFLPDTSRKMSVQPYAYLSSNESTLQFDAGMLTQAAAVVDETVVPTAALDALAKALGAAAKAALNAPTAPNEAAVPVPYLFKIVVVGDKVYLKGGPVNGAALDPSGTAQMVIRATLPK
jgi:hypothetical protein